MKKSVCTKSTVGGQICYLPVDCHGSVLWQSGLTWRILAWRSPGQIWQLCEGWRIQPDDLCLGCLSASPMIKKVSLHKTPTIIWWYYSHILTIHHTYRLNSSCSYRWFLNPIFDKERSHASQHAWAVPSLWGYDSSQTLKFRWFLSQLLKIVPNIALSTGFCCNCWEGEQRWCTFGRKLACKQLFWSHAVKILK